MTETYAAEVINTEEVAQDTILITLTRPQQFDFVPGQYSAIIFPHRETDEKRDYRHTFSVCSSPSSRSIQFMTRLRSSDFKSKIAKLKIGDSVEIAQPGGSFILPTDQSESVVIIAGGIGITPVMSMLYEEIAIGSQRKIDVIWSNKSSMTTPLLSKFMKDFINGKNSNIRFIITMTQSTDADWTGETGRIGQSLIQRVSGDLTAKLIYIVGTEDFVIDLASIVTGLGVEYEKIRSDSFAGY